MNERKCYYFEIRGDDPIPSKFPESEYSMEFMKMNFVGKFTRTGDEEHDYGQIIRILTQEQADRYFKEY